ncbi:hypothetical protein D9Q98_007731 [Chlorella vulgaris]|uniref:Uncharacterized protein n=1 Tax=Chlorella vulgaris TaxID=3077 RepID=A0A9D4THD2_CHLVU|nr:hypothetical protein D9Q98_007731 [Chlorella vulgaris]
MQMQRPRLPASTASAAAAASLAPLLPAGGEEAPCEATLQAAQPPIACLTSTSLSSLPSGFNLDSDSSGVLFEFESGCFAEALPPTPRLAVLGVQASSAQPGTPPKLAAGFENRKPPTALERLKQAQRRISRTSGSLVTAREASSAEACRSTNALVALKRRRLSAWGMYPAPPIC